MAASAHLLQTGRRLLLSKPGSSIINQASALSNATLMAKPSASVGKHFYSTTTDKSPPHPSEGFLHGAATSYMETMYEAWKVDPKSVHVSWQAYFNNVSKGAPPGTAAQSPPPTLIPEPFITSDGASIPAASPNASSAEILDHMKVQLLVRAYQVRGHHLAHLDPLGISKPDLNPPELKYTHYGFTEKDLDRVFHLGQGMLPGFLGTKDKMTLGEIIQSLEKTYCGKIGIEYAHILDRTQCDWLRERFEVSDDVIVY